MFSFGVLNQRANIKVRFKLEKMATETYEIIETLNENIAMPRKGRSRGLKSSPEGREKLADNKRSGLPSTARRQETGQFVKWWQEIVQ